MSVYRTPNGRAWRAFLKYRGHRDSRTFSRKQDAIRWLTEQRAEIDRGPWLDPSRAQVPVGSLFEKWLAGRDIEGSTRRNDRAIWHAYLEGRFGRMPLSSVSAPIVREWVAGLQTKRGSAAPRTKRDALRVLRGVLAYAREECFSCWSCRPQVACLGRSYGGVEQRLPAWPGVLRATDCLM